jgi:mono/diheme cytochrome c family protein
VKIGVAFLVLLGVVEMAQFGARAEGKASTRDGVYTAAQAGRGEASYKKACASCHGDKLDGSGQIPGLGGDEFEMMWAGQTLDDLFERIQGSMPADNPGKLTRTENADILAYLLKVNKLPTGMSELSGDAEALKKIQIDVAK